MRIESLHFIRANDSRKEYFDFSSDKLNVLITPTGFGRSMIAEAIWSILYGHHGNEPCRLRAGVITVLSGQKRYKVSREFVDNRFSFKEYNGSDGETVSTTSDAPGRVLSGLDVDVFREVCMMEENSNDIASTTATLADHLSSLLSRTKDSDEGPERAIACIENALQTYHFKEKTYPIDDLIAGLERGRLVLLERLRGLEQEKIEASDRMQQLSELEKEISQRMNLLKREDHFQLSMAVADLDSRILTIQERALMETELQREQKELGDLSDFPLDAVRKVEEMWSKREATLQNYARLAHDVDELNRTQSELDAFFSDCPKMEELMPDDAQALYGLARTMESVEGELEELNARRDDELRKAKSSGVDFDNVASMRRSLLSMESHDFDEANNLAQQMRKGKQGLSEAVQITQRIERDIDEAKQEYERAAKTEKYWRKILLAVCLTPFAFFFAAMYGPHEGWAKLLFIVIAPTISVTAILLSIGFLVRLHRSKQDLNARLQRLKKEYSELSQSEAGASLQLSDLQRRADRIAQQYEIATGAELLKQITSYVGNSAKLKDLDLLDQIIASREKQLKKIIGEIDKHLRRTGMESEQITPDLAVGLADNVQRYREQMREREKIETHFSHKKSELKFLEGEIKDIDSHLRDAFYRARLDEPEEIAASIAQFRDKAAAKKRYDSIARELERRESERNAETVDRDLGELLDDLQSKRQEAWTRLQELITANPFLAESPASGAEAPGPARAAELLREVEVLTLEYQEIREQIRTVTKNFDDYYPKTQHELEVLERNLARINHHKNSLELAKKLLSKVAQESRVSWSKELSRMAASMLNESGMEFETVEWDEQLGIRLRLRGHSDIIGEDELERRLSKGMLNQVNWIVRMAVALVVCESDSIPIILDEPFARIDDQKFLSGIRLLISLLPRLQIIVLSCHQLRHSWLAQQLTASEAALLNICTAEEPAFLS